MRIIPRCEFVWGCHFRKPRALLKNSLCALRRRAPCKAFFRFGRDAGTTQQRQVVAPGELNSAVRNSFAVEAFTNSRPHLHDGLTGDWGESKRGKAARYRFPQ